MKVDPRVSHAILVDAHVHLPAGRRRQEVLDGALDNFRRGAAGLGFAGPFVGVLMLAEIGDAHFLQRWRADQRRDGEWRFEFTAEEEALAAIRNTGERLVLVAGRQITTAEGVEVLALGRDLDPGDGQPLAETLERVRDSSALPVLPWGLGKWFGARGREVEAALRGSGGRELFLGDNSGRLNAGPEPSLFRVARELGVPVLPGSDPLPLPGRATQAGSYGFVLPGALDRQRPTEDLLRRIRQAGQPRAFGRRAGLWRFLRDQSAMQLRRGEGGTRRASAGRRTEAVQ